MSGLELQLQRDPSGQLIYTDAAGNEHHNVHVVRAYPISAPDEGISLLGDDGHELIWIATLTGLSASSRIIVETELATREFMPKIASLKSVSSYATPSVWKITTDRGDTTLTLKAEDHIRRLDDTALLITDSQGISFLIADSAKLDRHSKKLLDRFL